MNAFDPSRPLDPDEVDHQVLFRLDGCSYVVLGAGAGIGEHVARTIVGLGGRVMCVDVASELVAAVADSLAMPHVVADATTEAGIDRVAEAVTTELGCLDGYVDVIGRMLARPMAEYGLDDWDADVRMNLSHALLAGRRLAPLVETGSIVHVSSVVGSHGGRLAPGYGPSKAALEVWVKQLAAEHGRRGVRVNAVAPGLFLSPRVVAGDRPPDEVDRLAARPLLGRLGQPHEIAAAVVFLLSPAAGYVTGTTLPVEGGALSRDSTGLDELSSR